MLLLCLPLPQVRGNLNDGRTRRLIEVFGAPIHFHSKPVRGTLRGTALKRRRTILLYEAGEPLRFDAQAIEIGVAGVLRVMRSLGMWEGEIPPPPEPRFHAASTRWLRAPRSGIFHLGVSLGETVTRRQVLGRIADPFSRESSAVRAPVDGLVIGFTNNPLVYQGGALIHLARQVTPAPAALPLHPPLS